MTEPIPKSPIAKQELLDEIINRRKLGDKKFHSETMLQQYEDYEEDKNPVFDKDPGVQNKTVSGTMSAEEQHEARRRTMSQPGPVSGGMLTATAARAARKRPIRNVMYAANLERSESDSQVSKLTIPIRGDDSGTITPNGDRGSPFPFVYNGTYRNGDVRSLNNYRIYTPMNGTTPRKRSVATMDAQSIRSVETQAPPPTSPEVNKRLTSKYLTMVLSSIYAILLVTLGLIIHIGDTIVDMPVSSVYSIILSFLGFTYHIYLMVDISRYKAIVLKNQRIKGEHEEHMQDFFRKQEEEFGMNTMSSEERTPEGYRLPGLPPPKLIPLEHKYCFSQGRHSGSFYLKLGAAGFALGHLIHTVLLITVQIAFLFDENISNDECVDYVRVAFDAFNPFFCFLQLYFVFKYSNVIILSGQGLAQFAFMHMIGSSLCFWISAIVRETVLALTLYAQYQYGNDNNDYRSFMGNETNFNGENYNYGNRFFNISQLYNENCVGPAALSVIFERFSPYLYPFSVEFNILIVAVYYIIWGNIGHCPNEENGSSETDSSHNENYSICKIPSANEENDFTSNLVIYADCHASNKGLFLGLIVMVLIAGLLIISFVFSSVGEEYFMVGYMLNDYTSLGLHTLLVFGVILTFMQTTKLDINEHPVSLLDDILLFVCLPAFFMETVFSLVATINFVNIVKSIDFIVMVIQVLIQTPLIIDALRRCSNSRKLRRTKPGRELIMFLIIINVGMWMFYTFSYKSVESLDERYGFYGKVVWTILGHISLPLIMFYRFHSSVCFADIWNSAYKPGFEH